MKFLASDLLEGRGVGFRGGDLTAEYLAAQFAVAGAKPAGDSDSYFQRVSLVGVETAPEASLTVIGNSGSHQLQWLSDFAGGTHRQTVLEEFDAEAVFAGHGITAPEFEWDDYQGIDIKGKVVVLFTNEPPSTDSKFFGGPALTYYGRWTYKFEQALRKGAAAVILIHTDATAGYGWDVVRGSWGVEEPQRKLPPDSPALAFAGWITREAASKILAGSGQTVDELLQLADSRKFRPFRLPLRVRGRIPSKVRSIETRNVAAVVYGSDPVLRSEAVVFSAHWDHLGIGPVVEGDPIYNGAVDNATGCAMLIEMARAWASLDQKPRRSALFLATTAEESGLLGSTHYAAQPFFPMDKTAAALNFDSYYPFGRVREVVLTGAERTTLWPLVQEAATRFALKILPDPHPEQGSYFRSDHFSFARAGVPAFSIKMASEATKEYNGRHYHRPSDEYKDDWDLAGLEQMARFGFLIGFNTANLEKLPERVTY